MPPPSTVHDAIVDPDAMHWQEGSPPATTNFNGVVGASLLEKLMDPFVQIIFKKKAGAVVCFLFYLTLHVDTMQEALGRQQVLIYFSLFTTLFLLYVFDQGLSGLPADSVESTASGHGPLTGGTVNRLVTLCTYLVMLTGQVIPHREHRQQVS